MPVASISLSYSTDSLCIQVEFHLPMAYSSVKQREEATVVVAEWILMDGVNKKHAVWFSFRQSDYLCTKVFANFFF